MKITYLTIFWVLYFTLHSLLASAVVKNYIQNKIGSIFRYYRIVYNLFAIVSMIPILVYQRHISTLFYYQRNDLTSTFGYFIIVMGVLLCVLTFKRYSIREFIGLEGNKTLTKVNLSTEGLNKYVRHPLYFATLLLLWGFFIVRPSHSNLAANIVATVYLYVGSKLEEKKLIKQYGERYLNYIKQVQMLIPRIKKPHKSEV